MIRPPEKNTSRTTIRLISVILTAWIFYRADIEFYDVTWGTGTYWGGFSAKWGAVYLLVTMLLIIVLFVVGTPNLLHRMSHFNAALINLRDRLQFARWALFAAVMVFPIWLLQFTDWGVILWGTYVRVLIWLAAVVLGSLLIEPAAGRLVGFSTFLRMFLLSGGLIVVVSAFNNVTSYPFSLGWSEGNRLWDYSLLFGKSAYVFDRDPTAYLDIGRQFNGGLPFLIPGLTIFGERFWLSLMSVLPYIVLGWLAFRPQKPEARSVSFLAGLWAFMFLNQGPIHAPLPWCAALIALAWGSPIWFAMPAVAISGYIAEASRFTWMFAPAMWIVMLELGGAPLHQLRVAKAAWIRAAVLGVMGLLGGYVIPILLRSIQSGGSPSDITGVAIATLNPSITYQPLLWYRLLPNATYGNGILLGLFIAVAPIISILLYLIISKRWVLNLWQKLLLLLAQLAFLAVGLIVSAKIGGGGDLHNLDMFLIGLMFTAALAWRAVGSDWISQAQTFLDWIKLMLALMIGALVLTPLTNLHPLSSRGDINWIAKLADAKNPNALGLLPAEDVTRAALDMLRAHVEEAQTHGDVLFMDQRQLLTFGYIQDVTLIPEYEKKLMMDRALSSDAAYFQSFYEDLAVHRFSLIISDPLRAPIKDSDYQFGEENNAWVKWVARPILCYYEPIETRSDLRLQLLAPKQVPTDCSNVLPTESVP